MRRWLFLLLALIGLAPVSPAFAQPNIVSNYSSFVLALASSNSVITNFSSGAQITAGPGQAIDIFTNIAINGGAEGVIFSGSNVTRIFHVHPGASLSLTNLQFYHGFSTIGGAIYNEGSLFISNCVFAGNTASNASGDNGVDGARNGNGSPGQSGLGAVGGAIFSKGPVFISLSVFTNNIVMGGNGGNGGNGINQFVFGGDGGSGGDGGGASGGAIYTTGASNFIYTTFFQNNVCDAGAGGLGGSSGSGSFGGDGGKGGVGASGSGGAIYCDGKLFLGASFFQANGVNGGATPVAQELSDGQSINGRDGGSATGGGIFLDAKAGGSAISNCTFLANFCDGGEGGDVVSDSSAKAGNGGAAFGGGIASGASVQAFYCTIATNFVVGGTNGVSEAGGDNGSVGAMAGADVYASPGVIELTGTILSGGSRGSSINAFGASDGGDNLSSDASGITQATSRANRNPLLVATVEGFTTNISVTTEGSLVTNINYPTTNFVAPVTTNVVPVTSTNLPSTDIQYIDLETNFDSLPVLYSYDLITGYTYTSTAPVTNTTVATNFLAGNNGGPTPTLAVSNSSPAVAFITGIPGIRFPLTDQRLYFRASPTTIGAYDPNAVPTLSVTNILSSTNFTIEITNPPPEEFDNVISFTNDGTNIVFTEANGSSTNISATNAVILTNISTTIIGITNFITTNIPTPGVDGPHIIGLGQGAMLAAELGTNITGIGFQWQFNGTNLIDNAHYSGTATSNLVFKGIVASMAGRYDVIAGTTAEFTRTSAVFSVTVTNLPTITFIAPAAGGRLASEVILVRGRVTQPVTITNVILWVTNLNGSPLISTQAVITGSRSSVEWLASIEPYAGTNILAAQAYDDRGLQSPIATRKFFSVQRAPLALVISPPGSGTVSGAKNGATLAVGQTYQLVAHPGGKFLFDGWSGGASGSDAATEFLMQTNSVITATFVTNIFLPNRGTYNGLFGADSDAAGPLGIIRSLAVTRAGAYSGTIFALGFNTNQALSGVFDPLSHVSTNVATNNGVSLSLSMTFTGSNIMGTVTNGAEVSPLVLEKVVATNFVAEYTSLLQPFETNAVAGSGYALMTNNHGNVVISGLLADGTAFSESTGVAGDGLTPVYCSLYTNGGALTGWVKPDGGSLLLWLNPASGTGMFPEGFTNNLNMQSSRWKAPHGGSPAIALPDGGMLTVSNGNLAAAIVFPVALSKGDVLVNTGDTAPTNAFVGAINPKNGVLTVTFNGGAGTVSARGAVLQGVTNGVAGAGFFSGTNSVGSLILTPNP